MCVAVPGRVVSIEPGSRTAVVSYEAREQAVDLTMTPHASVGDWVIAHSGFAVRVVTAADAAETLRLLGSMPGDENG